MSHYDIVCKECKKRIGGCRCMGEPRSVREEGPCGECSAKRVGKVQAPAVKESLTTAPAPSPRAEDLEALIFALEEQHNSGKTGYTDYELDRDVVGKAIAAFRASAPEDTPAPGTAWTDLCLSEAEKNPQGAAPGTPIEKAAREAVREIHEARADMSGHGQYSAKAEQALFEFAAKAEEMKKVMRKHGFVLDNLDDRWQKLAFTLYSELVEVSSRSEFLLQNYEEEKAPSSAPLSEAKGSPINQRSTNDQAMAPAVPTGAGVDLADLLEEAARNLSKDIPCNPDGSCIRCRAFQAAMDLRKAPAPSPRAADLEGLKSAFNAMRWHADRESYDPAFEAVVTEFNQALERLRAHPPKDTPAEGAAHGTCRVCKGSGTKSICRDGAALTTCCPECRGTGVHGDGQAGTVDPDGTYRSGFDAEGAYMTINDQMPIWSAINTYMEACGGSPSTTNVRRQRAVAMVNHEINQMLNRRLRAAPGTPIEAAGPMKLRAEMREWPEDPGETKLLIWRDDVKIPNSSALLTPEVAAEAAFRINAFEGAAQARPALEKAAREARDAVESAITLVAAIRDWDDDHPTYDDPGAAANAVIGILDRARAALSGLPQEPEARATLGVPEEPAAPATWATGEFTFDFALYNMLMAWKPDQCRFFFAMLSNRPDFNPAAQEPAAGEGDQP